MLDLTKAAVGAGPHAGRTPAYRRMPARLARGELSVGERWVPTLDTKNE